MTEIKEDKNLEIMAKILNSQDALLHSLSILENPNRKKIFSILRKKRKMNIFDIYKEMNPGLPKKKEISYKSVYMNVKALEQAGILKLTKNDQASGKAVLVEFAPEKARLLLDQLSNLTKQIK